jgi:nucleotide-binding universal stress UspA family protein
MRVLLATDGSDDARTATEWLATFPLPGSTRLRVITAVMLPPSPIDIPTVREYCQALLDDGARIVESARAVLAARWPDVETRVLEGDPREKIAEAVQDWEPDLVALGARGLGAWTGALLGSVSTAVVRDVSCPVLVVKGRPRGLERVVIAVDGSVDSIAAARFFASLPLERRLEVRLLAVAEPPPGLTPPDVLAIPVPEALVERRRGTLEGVLSRVEAELRPRADTVECSVIVGRPATEIISAANEPGVDLVVVGARGLGRLERLILGSVSERVLHQAECPVLVVKRPRG